MERVMRWWKEGKMLNKKNTFSDFISCAKFLIEKKYTSNDPNNVPKKTTNEFKSYIKYKDAISENPIML